MEAQKVAVIGAGTIGLGLAVDLSAHGYDVVVNDTSQAVLDGAPDRIAADLRMYRMLVQEYRDVDDEAVLRKMVFTGDLSAVADVDFVIENITEDLNRKTALLDRLATICRKNPCVATNTSCISVTKLGARLADPSRMIGMHFMNPVPVKKFVEMIRGERTSEETIACARALAKRLGKEHVLVNDYPGFVSNRVMMLTVNECAFVVQDGVADAAQVDKVFRLAFGHGMGPLATADLIGLDTVLNSIVVLFEAYKDSKYRPCPLLQKMVDAGYLGRKSGKGFFTYNAQA
jgi:3-hydroxybutyryl-CoA dehydrogenase